MAKKHKQVLNDYEIELLHDYEFELYDLDFLDYLDDFDLFTLPDIQTEKG